MTDFEMITDVRLVALETIVQKMLAGQMAALAPEESRALKEQFVVTSWSPDVFLNEGPQGVDARSTAVLADWVEQFFRVVEERERDIRARHDLPPADPL